jgi:cobalt/nickel transport protein
MRKTIMTVLTLVVCLALAVPACAHFGMIIPDRNIVDKNDPKTVNLHYLFWHPMENQGMEMARPVEAGCFFAGQKVDLLPFLKEKKVAQKSTWIARLPINKPADYVFHMTTAPYWEPAEDKFVVHYTKTVVSVLGAQEGWDQPLGQKVEIIPLTRPYCLYAGNVFSGRVLFKGKPLAEVEVEVEFYNPAGKRKAPGDAYVVQVVKTDANGQFVWSFPWAGWWGMAALAGDDEPMKKDGYDKKIEVGGVLWLYVHSAK